MKTKFDFEKIAEAELVGALAIRSGHKHSLGTSAKSEMTTAQRLALSEVAHSLLKAAKAAGAEHSPFIVNDVSFELHENGNEDVLSIRTAAK